MNETNSEQMSGTITVTVQKQDNGQDINLVGYKIGDRTVRFGNRALFYLAIAASALLRMVSSGWITDVTDG